MARPKGTVKAGKTGDIPIGNAYDAKTGSDGKTRRIFNEARARAKKPAGQRGKSTKRKYSGINTNRTP